MINSWPGSLLFGSSPTPTPYPVRKFDRRHTDRFKKERQLVAGKVVGGSERGAESFDCKKALPSINNSIHSDMVYAVAQCSVLEF